MGYNNTIRICPATNGYTVHVRDPELEKRNRKSDGPYTDPDVEFVFTDKAEALEFVGKAMESLSAAGEYDTAFAKALTEDTK